MSTIDKIYPWYLLAAVTILIGLFTYINTYGYLHHVEEAKEKRAMYESLYSKDSQMTDCRKTGLQVDRWGNITTIYTCGEKND